MRYLVPEPSRAAGIRLLKSMMAGSMSGRARNARSVSLMFESTSRCAGSMSRLR